MVIPMSEKRDGTQPDDAPAPSAKAADDGRGGYSYVGSDVVTLRFEDCPSGSWAKRVKLASIPHATRAVKVYLGDTDLRLVYIGGGASPELTLSRQGVMYGIESFTQPNTSLTVNVNAILDSPADFVRFEGRVEVVVMHFQ
jgi:hypothetical protein